MTNNKFFRTIFPTFFLLAGLITTAFAQKATSQFVFPELPYSTDALEPYLDAKTVDLHYNKHHKGYYNKFVNAINGTEFESESIEQIFSQADKLDAFVRNNAGGYYNHMLYWENMTSDQKEIPAKLEDAIIQSFKTFDNFKTEFNKAASSVFGSGWAWLVRLPNGELAITITPNQDNPLMNDLKIQGKPLLALDVWEHAYYLDYQNKRADYIDAFWNIINWDVVAERYSEK